MISLIAAVDENLGLGRDNQLLCHLPADLKHFKSTTLGKPVIMGRKTYESIGKALPGRMNIVLSKTSKQIEGVTLVNSIAQAFELVKNIPEVMIIGGSTLYEQMLPYAKRIYLTHIHHSFDADVFFPKLDESIWHCKSSETIKKDDTNPYDMTFRCYEREQDK